MVSPILTAIRYGFSAGQVLRHSFDYCLVIFLENMLKSYFPNGDGIILLHGALVKSKVYGLKSRNL